MKDLSFKRNPANGLQGINWGPNNDAVFDDSEQHAVMASLVAMRAKWWADQNGTFGSNLDQVQTINQTTTASQVEAYAREALAELVKAGRITIAKIVVDLPQRGLAGRISLAVYWSSRGATNQETKVFL